MKKNLYVLLVMLLLASFFVGCGGSSDSNPAGPSNDLDPAPTAGFVISNLRFNLDTTIHNSRVGIYHVKVDYTGADGGIDAIMGYIDGDATYNERGWGAIYMSYPYVYSKPTGNSGTADSHGYGFPIHENGTHTVRVYLIDKKGRTSNTLTAPVTVTNLPQ